MNSQYQIALTIFGMAIATYLTRCAGYFLVTKFKVTGRLEKFIKAIPGTILISIVAPAVFTSSLAEGFASLVTIAVAWRTNNLPISMIAGVIAVVVARQF